MFYSLFELEKTEGEETEHSLPLEIFQKVIKRQCDAVVALDFDPSVKVRCLLLLMGRPTTAL